LGDDFSEEVHHAIGSSYFTCLSKYSENLSSEGIFEIYTPQTRAWGQRTLYEAAPRGGVSKHVVTVRRRSKLVCHYVLDGSAAGHTGRPTIDLGETRSGRTSTQPREYHGRARLSGEASSVHTKPFVAFADVLWCDGCRWRVISNSTRPTARHSRYSSGRSTAYQGYHGWPLIGSGSCGYILYADLS
jgi:hypothetical protein